MLSEWKRSNSKAWPDAFYRKSALIIANGYDNASNKNLKISMIPSVESVTGHSVEHIFTLTPRHLLYNEYMWVFGM